jgi:hypothetical protein
LKPDKFGPLDGFEGGFVFFFQKIQIRSKVSKLIYFKSEKYETSTSFFLKI